MEIRHKNILPIRHPGERDASPAGNDLVDVVREALPEPISNALVNVEGGMEGADAAAPGFPHKVHEGLYDVIWGQKTNTQKRMSHWRPETTQNSRTVAGPN